MDQAFEGLGKLPGEMRKKLALENQDVWMNLVDLAIGRKVDMVVIAGDTFHQPNVPVNTQHHFIKGLSKLENMTIPVVLTFGNHDYYISEKYWFEFPSNVYVMTSEEVDTVQFRLKTGEMVSVSGFSYESKWLQESKSKEFPVRCSDSDYHIGVYHGQLQTGKVEMDRYAPFNISELKQLGYDYWAMGHIHQPQILSEEPLMVYPGSPVGHTKKERSSKGAVLVDLGSKDVKIEWLPVATTSWQSCKISLNSVDTLSECLVETEEQFKKIDWEGKKLTLAMLEWYDIPEKLRYEISEELEQQEVLMYLQERLYHATTGKVWLASLNQEPLEKTEHLPLGLSDQLIQEEILAVDSTDGFYNAVSDLFRQPELRQLIEQDDNFKEAVYYETYQHLLNDLGGRGATIYEN